MSEYDSNNAGNNYQFHCPVVGRTALYIACAFMHKKKMRGNTIPAKDCHCAMNGGKCPAEKMMKLEWKKGEKLFHDDKPKLHTLPREIIEQIERVQLYPFWGVGLGLNPAQEARLYSNKLDNEKGELLPAVKYAEEYKPRKKKEAIRDMTDGLDGIGDMSDMLNSALEKNDVEK